MVWLLLLSSGMRPETIERHARRESGFTLMELVIALALAGAIGLIAAPQLSAMRAEYDLATAANTLAFEITRTRMQAVGQNYYMRVRPLSATEYARERSADGVSYTQDGSTTTLPSQVTLTVGETGSPTFNRSGIANASTTVTLSRQVGDRTYTNTIVTSALGRVSVS